MSIARATILGVGLLLGSFAQTPASRNGASADRVVAQVDGQSWSAAQVNAFVAGLPPDQRNAWAHHPLDTLGNVLMLRYLARQTEAGKLDQDPELNRNLTWARLNLLAQAEVNRVRASYLPSGEDQQRFYERNRSQWDQASVRVIFVAFQPGASGGAAAAEEHAREKLEELRARIGAGADFAAVARENSDDPRSAANGGLWNVVTRHSAYPESILLAIFALQAGQVGPPVHQPNGFYLFKLDSLRQPTFAEVEPAISRDIEQTHLQQWLESIQKQSQATIVDADYFDTGDAGGDGDDDDDDDDPPPAPRPRAGEPLPTHPPEREPRPPRPEPPAGAIVAKVDGDPWTAGKLRAFIGSFPPHVGTNFGRHPAATLNNLLALENLARLAESHGLAEDPTFEPNLYWAKTNLLSQAELSHIRSVYQPTPAEEKASYESGRQRWEQAAIHVIEVDFSPSPAPPPFPAGPGRTETQAVDRIQQLRRRLDSGATFSVLAAECSDDRRSAASGGNWPPFTRNGPYPEALKEAAFALKSGEVSVPVRLPNAFYLVQLESLRMQPFAEVEATIRGELQQMHFNDWYAGMKSRFTVAVQDEAYFAAIQ